MKHHQMAVFLRKLFAEAGGARARRLGSLLESGQWELLQRESPPDPTKYRYANTLKRDRLIAEILRKCKLPRDLSNNDTRLEAVRTFWSCEAQCGATNRRLVSLALNASENYFESSAELAWWQLIVAWRKEISLCLGKLPSGLTPKYSGGATISHKGDQATIPDKMSVPGSIYPESVSIYEHAVKHTQVEFLCRPFQVVSHNVFFTVPKDSVKDRGCCKEASLSLQLQLAVGEVMKQKYRQRYKVDLKQAKPLHMHLAREASAGHASLATIDLSNASDTVSYWLVALLLPWEWFTLVDSLRAERTEIDGRSVVIQKFSSMGNGFTFELETLLFRSLCTALQTEKAWVFGDDIIVDQGSSKKLLEALEYFGFTPNTNKTFCEGPFRESCGGDYFEGQAVRPHFLKEFPDEPQQWVALANGLLRGDPEQRWTRSAWRFCFDQVPSVWRGFVPRWAGDTGFHHPDGDWAVPNKRDSNGTPWFFAMVPIGRKVSLGTYGSDVQLASLLLGVGSSIPQRGKPKGYRRTRLPLWGLSENASSKLPFPILKPPRPARPGLWEKIQ